MALRNSPRFVTRSSTTPFYVFWTLALLVSIANPLSAQEDETLTNADVIKMVQAHLSADVIGEQIRQSQGNFLLTRDSLIKLKQAGVPDKVIAAMQAKHTTAAAVPETNSGPPVAKQVTSHATIPEGPEGVWKISEGKDQLTSKPFTEARTWAGSFEVEAQCEKDRYLALWLTPRDNGIRLVRSVVPDDGNRMLGEGHSGELCTHMQVMAGRVVEDYYSSYCDGNYKTSIVFVGENYSPQISGIVGTLNQSTLVPGVLKDKVNRALGMPMHHLRSADSLGVRLPLSDGSDPVIHLNLADPTFRNYYDSYCVAPRYNPNRNRAAIMADGFPINTDPPNNIYETAGGFAAELPGFLRMALAGGRLQPEAYSAEMDYVVKAVQACGSINSEMVASFTHDGKQFPAELGESFKPCALHQVGPRGWTNVTEIVKGYSPTKKRGLLMQISPNEGNGDQWGTGHRFWVHLKFASLPDDPAMPEGSNEYVQYRIVDADLDENSARAQLTGDSRVSQGSSHNSANSMGSISCGAAAQAKRISVSAGAAKDNFSRGPQPVLDPGSSERGPLTLEIVVGTDGHVCGSSVVWSPWPSESRKAQGAVAQWVYRPFLEDGQPVEADTYVHLVLSEATSASAGAGAKVGSPATDSPTALTPDMRQKQTAFLQGLGRAGIWLDTRTNPNLMWMKQDSHKALNWKEAGEFCSTLRLGGLSGWRLPSIDELRSLHGPLALSQLNPPITVGDRDIWSSTTQGDKAWTDDPPRGFVSTRSQPDRIGMRALCTRAYQPATDDQGVPQIAGTQPR